MKYRLGYILNVWFTSAFGGSALFFWGNYFFKPSVVFNGGTLEDVSFMFTLTITASILFSIPALLLFWLILHLLVKAAVRYKVMKWVLAFDGVIICTLTMMAITRTLDVPTFSTIACYSIPLVASVFFYRLKYEI